MIDELLAASGHAREIAAIASGFSIALALTRATDLIATVPDRHTAAMRTDLIAFPLPFPVPAITVSLLWHPRLDADAAHRWLRQCVREVCAAPDRAAAASGGSGSKGRRR